MLLLDAFTACMLLPFRGGLAWGFDYAHNHFPLTAIFKYLLWERTESNCGPPACKAGALNQLSYAPKMHGLIGSMQPAALSPVGLSHLR